jgi:predicted enzyme related to lactoylglutathione lyase
MGYESPLKLVSAIKLGAAHAALPSSNPAQFVQGAPVLHVANVEATAAFYRDVLGFTWDFGDDAYAVVWRDNSAIHFVRDDGSPKGVHLFQWVKDVDAYFKEVVGRGAHVAAEPTNQPYGSRLGIPSSRSQAVSQTVYLMRSR